MVPSSVLEGLAVVGPPADDEAEQLTLVGERHETGTTSWDAPRGVWLSQICRPAAARTRQPQATTRRSFSPQRAAGVKFLAHS